MEDDFEETREILEHTQFHDKDHFPHFDELPAGKKNTDDFYTQLPNGNYIPTRHWCFLAQIISVERSDGLRIVAKDDVFVSGQSVDREAMVTSTEGGEGKKIVISFSTDVKDIDSTLLQPDNTVAILYAHQHQFLDLTSGIRQETLSTFKIIPTTLDHLYQLSDRIQEYFPALDGKRICHGCDEYGVNRTACATCACFWYCSKDCQTKGLQEHEKDCKILKDRDVLNLLRIEYEIWTEEHKFPIDEEHVQKVKDGLWREPEDDSIRSSDNEEEEDELARFLWW